MKTFVGLDLSLTSTGLCLLDSQGREIGVEAIKTKELRGAERLAFIWDEISRSITLDGDTLVCMEGYAMGSKYGREQAGELGGLVRYKLHVHKVPFIVCPPTALKKFCTGKGVAEKEVMAVQVFKRWGREFKSNDMVDAYGLARIAQAYEVGAEASFQAEVIRMIRTDPHMILSKAAKARAKG